MLFEFIKKHLRSPYSFQKRTLDQIQQKLEVWDLKFEVNKEAQNVGGLTLFGKNFGNHNQDILVKTYYS